MPVLGGVFLPTQPASVPSATMSTKAPSIARQLRRRAGVTRSTKNARTAPPVPAQPLPFPPALGHTSALLLAEVELTVMVAVPVVAPLLRVTVELPPEQVGRSVAPAGDVVSVQVSVTVPAYPVAVVTVTVEVAGDPGATAAGVVAASVNTDAVTVTEAVPVPAT